MPGTGKHRGNGVARASKNYNPRHDTSPYVAQTEAEQVQRDTKKIMDDSRKRQEGRK